jgi:hypothetical protein
MLLLPGANTTAIKLVGCYSYGCTFSAIHTELGAVYFLAFDPGSIWTRSSMDSMPSRLFMPSIRSSPQSWGVLFFYRCFTERADYVLILDILLYLPKYLPAYLR